MANTLKFGNGQFATKEGSTLAYNDENGNFKPLPFTFDRSTSATRVNKQGLIEVVSNNEPRIDFLNDSKGALLLEPSRSNLSIQSSIQNMIASSSNSGVVEFGNLNNGLVSADITVNGQRQWYFSTANIVSGTEYTVSFYVDSFDLSSSNRPIFYIPTEGTNGVSSIYGSDIVLGRNTKTFTATANGSQFRIGLGTSSNDTGSIKLGGLQIEQGSYATSYIPTQGSIGTRVAESCEQTPPSGIIGQTEGTIYADVNFVGVNESITNQIFFVREQGSNNGYLFAGFYQGKLNCGMRVGGSLLFDAFFSSVLTKGRYKIAVAYKSGDTKIYINGIQTGFQDNSFGVNNFAQIFLTGSAGTNQLGDINRNFKIYNTRLTDQELINLTTI